MTALKEAPAGRTANLHARRPQTAKAVNLALSTPPEAVQLAKPNYDFAKRQRELAKKQKQEAKRNKKLAEKNPTGTEPEPDADPAPPADK